MAIQNFARKQNFSGPEGSFTVDNSAYSKALRESGFTRADAQEWWAENPTGIKMNHNSSVSVNSDTGKITVKAPEWFFDSETYNEYFNDNVLRGLSSLYSSDKSSKIQMVDGTEKTITELIEAWNKDISKMVDMEDGYRKTKQKIAERYGEEDASAFNLATYRLMNTSAYSGEDDDLLVLPQTLLDGKWSFFVDIPGFDSISKTISKKDFVDNYYYLDATRELANETGIAELKKAAASALDNYTGGNVEEFARLVAFNNFLSNETQEGADNSPEEGFVNKAALTTTAALEGAARATASFGTGVAEFVSKVALIPFSVVDWAGNLATTGKSSWNWIGIATEIGKTENMLMGGDYSVNGYETAQEFLDAQYAERGEFYNLTNQAVATVFTLSYAATKIAEDSLATKAVNALVLNYGSLILSKKAMSKTLKESVGTIEKIVATQEKTVDSAAVERASVSEIRDRLLSAGTADDVVSLLLGDKPMTFRNTMNLLTSVEPSTFITPTYQFLSAANAAGRVLKSSKYANFLYRSVLSNLRTTGSQLGDTIQYMEKTAYFSKALAQLHNSANSLIVNSGKFLAALGGYAKIVPATYYVSQVVLGTAMSESENIKKLIQGVDNAEQREVVAGMVGRAFMGWTIGVVAGKVFNLVKSGFATPAVEKANAAATEKIAKVETMVSGRINQLHEKIAGKDWVDNISDPLKKAAVKYNQSLQKSQEYMAKAADSVRAAGGDEAAVTNATLMAMNQMRANQNAIDLKQNTSLVIAEWSSMSYPAYSNAKSTFIDIDKVLLDMLDDAGLGDDIKTTALIGGVASNYNVPQDIVNYQVRQLQLASYLRDSATYSANNSVRFKGERELALAQSSEIESKYPKVITDYIKNKWAPAALEASHQLREITKAAGYEYERRAEGWQATGMFGEENELYFPTQRVMEAQKDYEEALRNPMKTSRSGAIRKRNFDPKHYVPGSVEKQDFVSPMLSFLKMENQLAIDYADKNFIDVNLSNPFVKHETKLDGSEVGAVKTFQDLKPSLDREAANGLNSIKEDLSMSDLVTDLFDKNKMESKIRSVQKAVDAAKKKVDNIPNIEINITQVDKEKTVDGLSGEQVESMLEELGVSRSSEPTEFSFDSTPSYDDFRTKYLDGEFSDDAKVKEAMEAYQDNHAKGIISNLINGTGGEPGDDAYAEALRRAFTKRIVGRQILFSGGMESEWKELLENGEMIYKGVISTSTDPVYSAIFPSGSGRKVLLRLMAPDGLPATDFEQDVQAAGMMWEHEILLPTDLKLTVKKIYFPGEYNGPDIGTDISKHIIVDVSINEDPAEDVFRGLMNKERLKTELRKRCK